MLQQTQVSRVAERFCEFIAAFPTPKAMADATEDSVLALWSGLGYYRRARNLHAAARAITSEHQGHMPTDHTAIAKLPGVGRYTAGAITSIALLQPQPIVDGNVIRVLLRTHNIDASAADSAAQRWAWQAADTLVKASTKLGPLGPAQLNEGIMELGATVCTPKSPNCNACPLATLCLANKHNTQHQIPRPKPTPTKSTIYADALHLAGPANTLAIEQRPPTGLWASIWQPPTLENNQAHTDAQTLRAQLKLRSTPTLADQFTHQTTHRTISFRVWHATSRAANPPQGRWASQSQIQQLALGTPQRRILLIP